MSPKPRILVIDTAESPGAIRPIDNKEKTE